MYYVGLDVHKKSIAYCVKQADGVIVREGQVAARRADLSEWARQLPQPWTGAMEATLFSDWVFDHLAPLAESLEMGHPARMRAIATAKKKSDKLDARTICDLLRCHLLPPAYVMPESVRRLRRVLRYRNLLVRAGVQMQNKIAGLLLEIGSELRHALSAPEEVLRRAARSKPRGDSGFGAAPARLQPRAV